MERKIARFQTAIDEFSPCNHATSALYKKKLHIILLNTSSDVLLKYMRRYKAFTSRYLVASNATSKRPVPTPCHVILRPCHYRSWSSYPEFGLRRGSSF
ncbi:hypothetical protein SNK03_13570 [Fusarium graminearum]|nr:unnamed protein product [Fusarium graminearum]